MPAISMPSTKCRHPSNREETPGVRASRSARPARIQVRSAQISGTARAPAEPQPRHIASTGRGALSVAMGLR
ncbi:hypothetical protein GCM10022206_76460 [Streptomyces chiangmaiensis]